MRLFRPAPPKTRHVRIHLQIHQPTGEYDGTMTMEGFLHGVQPVCGDSIHGEPVYLLDRPKILENQVDRENHGAVRVSLDASHGELPARRVIFVEVLAVDGEK